MTWGTETETGLDRERSQALASLREREKRETRRERRGEVGACGQGACILVGRGL